VSTYDPEESHRSRVLEALDSIDTRLADQHSDARAQLWARVYAAEYELCRREQGGSHGTLLFMRDGQTTHGECAKGRAREAADAAAADFDEHYLGGKR
jgi:hypothetical protein